MFVEIKYVERYCLYMKFLCSKSDLIDSIAIVQKAIKTNSTVAILDGILIQAENDSVKLTGYDLETGIEADLTSDVVEQGSVVVNSKLFGDMIRNLPHDMVTISTDDRNQVYIQSGAAEFTIKGNSAESYPKIPIIETNNKITISQKILRDMINHTIFAVSKDDTRQSLTGCNLVSDGKSLTMVAIDGFRMALRREAVGDEFPEMNFIIPGKTLNEASKIFDDDDEKEVIIYSSSNNLLFDIGDVRIISRLISGPFVNFNAIIQKNPKSIMTVNRKQLLESIQRAALVIMTDDRRCPVQLAMNDSSTLIISANTESSTLREELDVSLSGDTIDIDFNSKYLIDALKNVDDDEVKIEFNGGNGPCIVVPTEGEGYVYLILPIRR